MSRHDKTDDGRPLDDLLVVMERLERFHGELRDTLAAKLDRMRRADHAGLGTLADREKRILLSVHEQEGLRKQMMERVGRGYGIAAQTARIMPARQLAQRVGEPYRQRITAAADRLKAVAEEAGRANALITRVSQQVLDNLREAFAGIGGAGQPAGVYTSAGTMAADRPQKLFEMVG